VLGPDEIVELQLGVHRDDGNAVVIAAGTGLGQAYLHRVNGRLTVMASEGGHAEFAARTDREMALVRMLREMYGRAEVEHVLSGPGLLNLHRFTHNGQECDAVHGVEAIDAPARVSQQALEGSCRRCADALSLFVEAYGAEASNLALRGVATSGVFVGGGIAPKILPALQDGRFIEAFRAKGDMSALVAEMPVHVILAPETGLVGAAVAAQDLAEQ
jgi:glucokinase